MLHGPHVGDIFWWSNLWFEYERKVIQLKDKKKNIKKKTMDTDES